MNNLQAIKQRYGLRLSNRDLLISLRKDYRVTNLIMANLSGYSHSHVDNMTAKVGCRATNDALVKIASALAVKYPRK